MPKVCGWISGKEIADFIREEKPQKTYLALTGRDALPEVIEVADTVTESRKKYYLFGCSLGMQRFRAKIGEMAQGR